MNFHLNIVGLLLLLLALLHIIFPKYFQWKNELSSLTLVNRQMMEVHTLFIAVTVGLMGVLCLWSKETDWQTGIGKMLALGLCLFWLLQLFVQWFYYSSKLWKGKMFETTVHILFTMLWGYFTWFFFLLSRLPIGGS